MAFCRVSTGDSDILSSCDMNDQHALSLCREIWPSFESGHLGAHFEWSINHSVLLTYIFLRENSSWGACGKMATASVEDRESALISRRYGVPGSFIRLLYWNWCSYRLEIGVSENLWIVVKDVKILAVYDVECDMAMDSVKGNVLHRELIWGTPIYFAFLRWHQCSSLVLTVFLGIHFSSIREIEVPYMFDWEHGTPQHAMQGNRASFVVRGKTH